MVYEEVVVDNCLATSPDDLSGFKISYYIMSNT